MEDITVFRMTHDQLVSEVENNRFQTFLLSAINRITKVGYYEWSYEHDCLLTCTDEYAAIYNKTREQMLEAESSWKKTLSMVHPEDQEAYQLAEDSIFENETIEVEYRIVLDNGQVRHVREISVIERNELDDSVKNYGIMQDITGIREKRQISEYKEALANQAEKVTAMGHYLYNELTENYTHISPGLSRIFGVDADEYMAMVQSDEDDLDDIHPDDVERVKKIYDQYDDDGVDYSVEYRLIQPDGNLRWLREQNTAFRKREGKTTESLGVIQDITVQKTAEIDLLDAQSSLEEKVALRTHELAKTVKLLEEARGMLETKVERRTRELAKTVSQLKEEISEKEKIAAELKFLAHHDALTGLPSLRLCIDRLERSIVDAKRNEDISVVMFLDLDGFKVINDTHGHEAGDNVLKQVAERILENIRDADTAARVGGDEFVVILSAISDLSSVGRIARSLIESISADINIRQGIVKVGASIGIASYPDDGSTAEELIRQADTAMYMVKHNGKNNFGFLDTARLN